MEGPAKPARGDLQQAFANVQIPWLLMTGTNDVVSRLSVYPALPAGNKYELMADEAGHFAFTDWADFGSEKSRNPNHHRVILALGTAFWDAF